MTAKNENYTLINLNLYSYSVPREDENDAHPVLLLEKTVQLC